MKSYRLKKSLSIFHHVLRQYKRKRKRLAASDRKEVVDVLNGLQEALINKEREVASSFAKKAETFERTHLAKSFFEKLRSFFSSLVFALIVATLIRTMWFEFYEIPTGSMRPTLAEQDRLVVSKTSFGINIPLYKGHIYFEPHLLQRSGTLIFTGRDMDIADLDTLYFYIFPGKKQFVKRLIGKPGDTLYFYGGLIYGIDAEGNDISDELQPSLLNRIDHVPYISFNGRMDLPAKNSGNFTSHVTIKQMNEKVAYLEINHQNRPVGALLEPYKSRMQDYYDLWGFKTYGMARLLTKEEAASFKMLSDLPDAPLYMEVFHHPSIKNPLIQRSPNGRLFPGLGVNQTIIPLTEKHLQTLFDNLYTARFVVKEGLASRFGSAMKPGKGCHYCVPLSDVPDGTYEFYYGTGYQVHATGICTKLPKDHPLYTRTPERLQTLYNLGIEWMTPFSPKYKVQGALPSRYVYFRFGDLYALGAPLMKKDDPTLVRFVHQEHLKEAQSPSHRPYHPFEDAPPLFNAQGKVDHAFIKRYGIVVPASHYLVLGDNYAMSADSREFGFVPEANIRGAPSFIFYPFGSRFGFVKQLPYPILNGPRVAIWIIFLIILGLYHRKHHKLPVKIDE